jgi:SOS-response transcriptional repressor LexA
MRGHISEKGVELRSENPDYEPIPIGPEDDFHVVGKVLAVRCTRTQGGDNE